MPAQALTDKQEAELLERVRKGANLSALQEYAKKQNYKVGRAKLGQLVREGRKRQEVPALDRWPELEKRLLALEIEVKELRQAGLPGKQTKDGTRQKNKGSELLENVRKTIEYANEAMQKILCDPHTDATAIAKIVGQLRELNNAAQDIANSDDSDEIGI